MIIPSSLRLCVFSILSLVVWAQAADLPTTVLIQPETNKANGDVIRGEDDPALGGEFVTHKEAYNPIFSSNLSEVGGDPIIVWARVKGMAIQLKGVTGESQKEFEWNWDASDTWKWVRVGQHTREEFGDGILIIRGPDAAEGAGLDAVILTSEPSIDPATLAEKDFENLTAK